MPFPARRLMLRKSQCTMMNTGFVVGVPLGFHLRRLKCPPPSMFGRKRPRVPFGLENYDFVLPEGWCVQREVYAFLVKNNVQCIPSSHNLNSLETKCARS